MAWNQIVAGDIAQDKPTTTTLWQKVKDCLDYLYDAGPQIYTTEGVDIIENRSFELVTSSEPDSWTVSETGTGTDLTVESSNSSRSGAKRAKIFTTNSNAHAELTSSYMEIDPKRMLWGSFWAYFDTFIQELYVKIYFYKGDKTASTESPHIITELPYPTVKSEAAGVASWDNTGGDPEWAYESAKWMHCPFAVIPPSDALFCKLYIQVWSGTNNDCSVYLDDVKLEQPHNDLRSIMEASDTLLLSSDVEATGPTAQTWTKMKEAHILKTGTYRVKFDMVMDGAHVLLYVKGRIYKNGSAWGTERTVNTGEAYTTFSEDLYFNEGDLIQVYGYGSGNSGHAVLIKNFRIYGTEEYIEGHITQDS